MAERLTVERSGSRALQKYLQTELDLVYGPGGVVVVERWPSPDAPLPERAVSIILVGQCDEAIPIIEPSNHIRRMALDPDPNFALYTFMTRACHQDVQLDIWSTYDVMRDELLFHMSDVLQKGSDHTLGIFTAGDPNRDGPLLKLDPQYGFDGFVDFTFQGPSTHDEPDSVRQHEYRASISGTFDVNLTTTRRTPIFKGDPLITVF